MRSILELISILTLALFCQGAWAQPVEQAIPIAPPPNPEKSEQPLSDRIFNLELTKEFDSRYREVFGQTEAEQNYNQPSRLTRTAVDGGQSNDVFEQEEEGRRKEFGQYMLRRLAEYHIDHYAKNEPQVRPAYEFKERVSQVKAEIAPGYRVHGKYSLSGNHFELKMDNPYVRTRAIMELGTPGPYGPETIYTVGRDLSPAVGMDAYYRSAKDQISLVATRALGRGLTASVTGSAVGRRDVAGIEGERLFLAGLSWIY